MPFIEIIDDEESFRLDVGDSYFELRRFDSANYNEIEKKHTKKKKNFRTGEWIKEVDDRSVNDDLLDYMVTGWGHIKSPTTGEDVPCEKKNKIKLPGSVKMQIIEACDADNITTGKKTRISKPTPSVASITPG